MESNAVALLASAALAFAGPGCGPDYVTQLPVVCERRVSPPERVRFPVAIDAEVGITEQARPLRARGAWGCLSWWARDGIVAAVSRCGARIGVAVFAVKERAARHVRITVAGAPA